MEYDYINSVQTLIINDNTSNENNKWVMNIIDDRLKIGH